MIEGLKFHFKTDDLATKIRARAAHHRGRAQTKEQEIPKLREAMDAIKAAPKAASMSTSSYRSDDPVKDLEADIRNHRTTASKFDQFADHLAPSEVYVLTVSDMQSLEIIS